MPLKAKTRSPGTVLITGGARRIGAELALYLAQQGFHISLHYNQSRKEAELLAKTIRGLHVSCEIYPAQLKHLLDTQQLIGKVLTKQPNLNIVINCASVFEKSHLRDHNLNDLTAEFAINFQAPYILTSQFAKLVANGQIINILDTNIAKNKITHFNYLLSKKALADFTKLAAIELAPRIRVNAVAPGLILPPEHKTTDYLDRLATGIPLKRRGSPKDISQAVHFLITNDYITGQTLFVDGGEHLI